MTEQLAIISEVGIGLRDTGWPTMWWTVCIEKGTCALNVFDWMKAQEIIKAYKVYDVKDLNGKPVWVEVGGGLIKYSRPWE